MAINEAFVALSDPVRRSIIEMLKNRQMSAGEIASNFDISGPAISYHLKKLKEGELVKERRVSTFKYYSINQSAFDEVLGWMERRPNAG